MVISQVLVKVIIQVFVMVISQVFGDQSPKACSWLTAFPLLLK